MSPAASRQAAAAFEREMLRQINDTAAEAETTGCNPMGVRPAAAAAMAAAAAAAVVAGGSPSSGGLLTTTSAATSFSGASSGAISAAMSAAAAATGSPLFARIDALTQQLEAGPPVSGKCWEALGRAWADIGQFSRAIAAYRRSLRAKSATASLVAMEQLGNLLVRRAQQVWAQARAGDPDGALKVSNADSWSVGAQAWLHPRHYSL